MSRYQLIDLFIEPLKKSNNNNDDASTGKETTEYRHDRGQMIPCIVIHFATM